MDPPSEVHRWTEQRRDIAASLASLSPAVAGGTVTGAITLGTLLSFETGLLSPLVAAVGVSLLVAYATTREIPTSVTKTKEVRRRGLPEQKLMRYLVMSNELREMEAEEREKARKDAETRSRQRRNFGGGRF